MPDKFDRCVEDVKASGTADNPFAVCNASINEVQDDIAKSMHEQQFGSENWIDEKANREMIVKAKSISTEAKNTVLGMSQNFYEKIFFHDKIEQGNSFDNKVTQEFIKVVESILKDFPHVTPTDEFIAIEMMRRGCDEALTMEFVKTQLSFETHKNPEMFPNVTNIDPVEDGKTNLTVPNINKEEDFEPNDTLFGGQKRQDALHPEVVEKKKNVEDFKEEEHPRGNGKFTSKGGGNGGGSTEDKIKDAVNAKLADADFEGGDPAEDMARIHDDLVTGGNFDADATAKIIEDITGQAVPGFEKAKEDAENPALQDEEDDALHAMEQNGEPMMMNGVPMPEPDPDPGPSRLFPFGRLHQDRCPQGQHWCSEEGMCVDDKAEELPPCNPGFTLNEQGECEQVVSDADIPELQLKANQGGPGSGRQPEGGTPQTVMDKIISASNPDEISLKTGLPNPEEKARVMRQLGMTDPTGMKIKQGERLHHVANSTMNNRPKEVGPLTQMDFGFPEDVTEQSGFFKPLRPTLSPLEPNSSNRPCDKGKVLNPVTGICEPENLTNQLTDPGFVPPVLTSDEKIIYPDYVTKVEESFECGCQNKTQEAIQILEA